MKSSSIRLVVILGAIAISGILLMQVWLFRMSWNSTEKEFHQTVSIALLNVAKSMAEYSGTIPGDVTWSSGVDIRSQAIQAVKEYHEQRRRALITELRALDKLLGRRQTIPRKER